MQLTCVSGQFILVFFFLFHFLDAISGRMVGDVEGCIFLTPDVHLDLKFEEKWWGFTVEKLRVFRPEPETFGSYILIVLHEMHQIPDWRHLC